MLSKSGVDDKLSLASESLARRISRRRLFVRVAQSTVAVVSGVAVGELRAFTTAEATVCTGASFCSNGSSGPHCPSGCSICTSGDGCNDCPHTSGYWTVSGFGTCGNGWVYCTDCKCPDCTNTCTSQSSCNCCTCCTPAQVQAELARTREWNMHADPVHVRLH
jgi:hypothetical protein